MASDEVMTSILQCHPVDLSASGRRRDGVDQHFVSLRCMAVGVPAKPGPVQHTEVLFAGDMICVWDLETTSKWPAFADPLDVCFRFLKVVVRGGRLDLEALPGATHFDSFVRPLGGKVPMERAIARPESRQVPRSQLLRREESLKPQLVGFRDEVGYGKCSAMAN
jgi:hypothetical protein